MNLLLSVFVLSSQFGFLDFHLLSQFVIVIFSFGLNPQIAKPIIPLTMADAIMGERSTKLITS